MHSSDRTQTAAVRFGISGLAQASALRLGLLYLATATAGRLWLAPVPGSVPLFAPELGVALGWFATHNHSRLSQAFALVLVEFALLLTTPGPAPPAMFAFALLRALVPPVVHLGLDRIGVELPANGSVRQYLTYLAVAGLAPGLGAALVLWGGGHEQAEALAAGLGLAAGIVFCAPPVAAFREGLPDLTLRAGLLLALGVLCPAVLLLLRSELWLMVGGLFLLAAAIRHSLIATSALATGLWWVLLGMALRARIGLMPGAEALSLADLLAAERDLALMAVMACALAVALEQERRLSAWALARARELEALVRALPDVVLRLDAEGRILDYRAGHAGASRVDPAQFLGRRLTELLPPPVAEMFAQAMGRARAALEPVQFEYALDEPSGQQRHVEARLSALGDQRLVVVLRDVTERARAEQELRARAQALARSNAELQQFAYIASHDLQEPLRTVAGFCELLQRRYGDRLDDTGREFIAFAVDGARRMQSLVRDLLDLSRIATRGRPFAPVDCGELLKRVLADLRGALAETGGRVDLGPLPVVHADASQLAQLFANLIGNALKYRGTAPPRVEIWAERHGAGHLFHVKDNGIGIPAEFHEQIFEPFRRLHTRDEYPGNGIGLAICRKIVDRHGGWIRVESAPGEGSDFQFWLPDRPVEPDRMAAVASSGAADAVPNSTGLPA